MLVTVERDHVLDVIDEQLIVVGLSIQLLESEQQLVNDSGSQGFSALLRLQELQLPDDLVGYFGEDDRRFFAVSNFRISAQQLRGWLQAEAVQVAVKHALQVWNYWQLPFKYRLLVADNWINKATFVQLFKLLLNNWGTLLINSALVNAHLRVEPQYAAQNIDV